MSLTKSKVLKSVIALTLGLTMIFGLAIPAQAAQSCGAKNQNTPAHALCNLTGKCQVNTGDEACASCGDELTKANCNGKSLLCHDCQDEAALLQNLLGGKIDASPLFKMLMTQKFSGNCKNPLPEKPAPVNPPSKPETPKAPEKPEPTEPETPVTPQPPTVPEPKEPEAPAQPPAQSGFSSQEQEMLSLVNSERAKAGLSALKGDTQILRVARLKSQDMINKNYFDHNSPTYGSPFEMMKSHGISYSTAGENIAMNRSVAAAHTALMNSPGHRANILNANYTHIGIGIAQNANGSLYITQMFVGR